MKQKIIGRKLNVNLVFIFCCLSWQSQAQGIATEVAEKYTVLFMGAGVSYLGDRNGTDMAHFPLNKDKYYYSGPGPMLSLELFHRINFIGLSVKTGLLGYGMNAGKLNSDITQIPNNVYKEAYVKNKYAASFNPYGLIGANFSITQGRQSTLLKGGVGFSSVAKPTFTQYMDGCPYNSCRAAFEYKKEKTGLAYELGLVHLTQLAGGNFLKIDLGYMRSESTVNATWRYFNEKNEAISTRGYDGIEETYEGMYLTLAYGIGLKKKRQG